MPNRTVCYISVADCGKTEAKRRLDATLAQIKAETGGRRVKWLGRDEDGDALLRIADETAEQTAARVATAQGLRLYRMPN